MEDASRAHARQLTFEFPEPADRGSIAAKPRSSLTLPRGAKLEPSPGECRCLPWEAPPTPSRCWVLRSARPPASPVDMASTWAVLARWQFRRWVDAHRTAHHAMNWAEMAEPATPHAHSGLGHAGDLLQLWSPAGVLDAQWRLWKAPHFEWRWTP